MRPLTIFTFTLGVYALSVTGWYQHDTDKNKVRVAKLEKIILMQEKLLLEMQNQPEVNCKENYFEDEDYTYDQFISNRPCPKGRQGPLCHMNSTPEAQ